MTLWQTIYAALFAKPISAAEHAEFQAKLREANRKIAEFKAEYPHIFDPEFDRVRELDQRI